MRENVKALATQQLTDAEIDATLAATGEHPMTPGEIAQAVETRLAGRGQLRRLISESMVEIEEIAAARELLGRTLVEIETKLEGEYYSPAELIRLGKFLASVCILPRAAALQGRLELGRQYIGFTRAGYDEDLRTSSEEAEVLAAAEREEQRRKAIENAH
jgi:hypothetical protein